MFTTEYRCAAGHYAARGATGTRRHMTAAVTKTDRRFLCPFPGSRYRGRKGEIHGIF